ncbi:MAG: chaperone protein DnaK [Pseudomonadota bacterium]|jgi:molecular chaperone DnaK
MGRIIGIDLGTTNTVVAVFEGDKARVLEDERGHRVIPSIVATRGGGNFVVGQAAANLVLTRPDRVVYAAKRFIGRRFDSAEAQDALKRVTYGVREAPDGGVELQLGEDWLKPEQVSAKLLEQARLLAERALGERVEDAIITVPAYFNHAQRSATLAAARLAGLRCDRLLNEPTAAALALGHRKAGDSRVVIFDLGGGTFDVSVLHMSEGVYEILATSGDTFLGGEDFDHRIADHLATIVQERHGVDVRGDAGAMRRLKETAERAKRDLASRERVDVEVPHLVPKVSLATPLDRATVEEITQDLVEKCIHVVQQAVTSAGLTPQRIDDVVLVGGMTRWPAVREAVRGLFGREPNRGVHPDEVVGLGAAVHAGSLGETRRPRAVLIDVTPFDLGIQSIGGNFASVIARNSRIPCTETRTFSTVRDEQESVKITVYQGQGRTVAENEFLGEFIFGGLPPLPRMQAKVAVTFRIDTSGMLEVIAADARTGEKRSIVIRNYGEVARGEASAVVEERGGPAPAAASSEAPATPAAEPQPARKGGLLGGLFGRRKAAPEPDFSGLTKAVPADPDAPDAASTALEEVFADAPAPVEPPPRARRPEPEDVPVHAIEDLFEPASARPSSDGPRVDLDPELEALVFGGDVEAVDAVAPVDAPWDDDAVDAGLAGIFDDLPGAGAGLFDDAAPPAPVVDVEVAPVAASAGGGVAEGAAAPLRPMESTPAGPSVDLDLDLEALLFGRPEAPAAPPDAPVFPELDVTALAAPEDVDAAAPSDEDDGDEATQVDGPPPPARDVSFDDLFADVIVPTLPTPSPVAGPAVAPAGTREPAPAAPGVRGDDMVMEAAPAEPDAEDEASPGRPVLRIELPDEAAFRGELRTHVERGNAHVPMEDRLGLGTSVEVELRVTGGPRIRLRGTVMGREGFTARVVYRLDDASRAAIDAALA